MIGTADAAATAEVDQPGAASTSIDVEDNSMSSNLRLGVLSGAAALAAVASWTAGVHDVRAPEPATLTSALKADIGATAHVIYPESGDRATGWRFPPTYTTAGCTKYVSPNEPCASGSTVMPPGAILYGLTQVSTATGFRRCRCAW
jgi:hypothetical protein